VVSRPVVPRHVAQRHITATEPGPQPCSARTRACRVHTRVNARLVPKKVFARVRTRHAKVRAPRRHLNEGKYR
jgi:hypothetical protein